MVRQRKAGALQLQQATEEADINYLDLLIEAELVTNTRFTDHAATRIAWHHPLTATTLKIIVGAPRIDAHTIDLFQRPAIQECREQLKRLLALFQLRQMICAFDRSEERRVGKDGKSRAATQH